MGENILSVTGIKKSFGGVYVLKGVNLTIGKGEIHCLSGENGCGKSTLIKIISGVYQADAGEITIDGETFQNLTPQESMDRGISVIYQDFALFPNLSVMENLALTQEIANHRKLINYSRLREIAKKAVEKMNYQVDFDAKISDLPIGDRQMIAIARSLMNNVKLIIMDEPTSALSRNEVNNLFAVIKNLKEKGISVLFVSHKIDEVFEISEKITIFRNGEFVISLPKEEMNPKDFSFYMTGRTLDKGIKMQTPDVNNRVLEVNNLSCKGKYSDVSFSLYKGEILGITGQLGSGRTELAQTLFGIMKPDKGEIKLEGKSIQFKNTEMAKKLGVAYVPEDRLTEGLFLIQSIALNTVAARLDDVSNNGVLLQNRIEKETDQWVEKLSIVANDIRKPANTLSGGNQQKVVLSKWLSRSPRVLILNCPTAGVDIGAKFDIYDLLREYARNGISIIVASDDLSEIVTLCNRVFVMKNGKIFRALEKDEISESNLMSMVL